MARTEAHRKADRKYNTKRSTLKTVGVRITNQEQLRYLDAHRQTPEEGYATVIKRLLPGFPPDE